jgi:tumor protein p53-inducible protein 3
MGLFLLVRVYNTHDQEKRKETTMRAVIAQDNRPVIVQIPDPEPKADELLVRVHATSLNRADLLQVAGNYPVPPDAPDTLGLELAGEVIGMGNEVRDFKIGDRVMALVGGGGYAEKATFPAAHAMKIPDALSYEEGAAIPEVFLTAYSNMLEIGGLLATDKVLIHAGAGGVGLAAIQIAKRVGATVIATASANKLAACLEHGADRAIDYKAQNFADAILESGAGVDLILDFIGAAYWEDNVRALNHWGRLVFVGLMGGATHEVNFGQIMRKRLTIAGSTLRDRSKEQKSALVGRFWKWAAPHFRTGALRPTVWRVLPLDEVAEAHRLMAENQNIGKIVLSI